MNTRFRLVELADAWQGFWFRTEPAYTLGLVRIAFGALVVGWTLALLPGLYDFFGTNGLVSDGELPRHRWSIFEIWTGDRALLIGWIVLLVAAIALTVGWHSRIAAILVFVLIVSFDRRNPMVFNSGDVVIRIEALLIALAPAGAALSLDQRRRTGQFWSAQVRPRWPIRLMQCQLSLIYLSTVQFKMSGETWPEGTAVSYALRLQDMVLLPIPDVIRTNALLMNAATWGTLVVELAIGILVWNRRMRPWVLGAGVLMHTTIMITIAIGFFSLAMFVLYIAFTPPDTAQRLVGKVRRSRAKQPSEEPGNNARCVAPVAANALPARGDDPSQG